MAALRSDPDAWVDEHRNPNEDAELEAEENRNDCTFDPTPEELGGCVTCRIGGTYNTDGVFVRRLIVCDWCIDQQNYEAQQIAVAPLAAVETGLNFRCWVCNRPVSRRGDACKRCER